MRSCQWEVILAAMRLGSPQAHRVPPEDRFVRRAGTARARTAGREAGRQRPCSMGNQCWVRSGSASRFLNWQAGEDPDFGPLSSFPVRPHIVLGRDGSSIGTDSPSVLARFSPGPSRGKRCPWKEGLSRGQEDHAGFLGSDNEKFPELKQKRKFRIADGSCP